MSSLVQPAGSSGFQSPATAVNNTYFTQQAPNRSKAECQFTASGEQPRGPEGGGEATGMKISVLRSEKYRQAAAAAAADNLLGEVHLSVCLPCA